MSPAPISLIAALSENRVIGIKNHLPWNLPEDLKRFRTLTSGHPIIMGRKTFESIGKPLPKRENIVITRDPAYAREGIRVASSLESAIEIARAGSPQEIFVIGGAEIYRLALPLADRLYLTLVSGQFEGDAFFPDWSVHAWTETSREPGEGCVYLRLDRLR